MIEVAVESYPFLAGVFIAVDALPGAHLVVDGPYCVAEKAELQYCHNLNSTLFSPHGLSRVLFTLQQHWVEEVNSLTADRTAALEGLLRLVQARPGVEVVLTTEFDFVHLTGAPLAAVATACSANGGPPVLALPSRSLGGDWLDGYAGVLQRLAEAVPLESGRARADAVALVGYFAERTELDHRGNLRELGALLAPFGLELCSTWLSGGQSYFDLRAVEQAGLVISLPYAREAARTLGRRLQVPVLELELPIGLGGTERFVRQLGSHLRQDDVALRLVEREAAAAVRDTERSVMRFVAGRRASLALDPHLLRAAVPLCRELGLELVVAQAVGREPSGLEVAVSEGGALDEGAPVFRVASVAHQGRRPDEVPVLFGYPNFVEHPLSERPFMGYAGFRNLCEKFATAALWHEFLAGGQSRAAPT